MNSLELISFLTRKQVNRIFDVVKTIPTDKLDWQPAPGSRSVRDQLQEVATVFEGVPDAVRKRKLEMSDEDFAQYTAERKKIDDVAALERLTRDNTERFLEFVSSVNERELADVVEMPWPGDFRVADLLTYHYWNMTYHEGQITYIASMLQNE